VDVRDNAIYRIIDVANGNVTYTVHAHCMLMEVLKPSETKRFPVCLGTGGNGPPTVFRKLRIRSKETRSKFSLF
jgi:hypothetical protein